MAPNGKKFFNIVDLHTALQHLRDWETRFYGSTLFTSIKGEG